jgi:predicted HNH restriction endonuclease
MANYKLKQFVTERAKGCCEYCMSQEKYASQSFSLDHIFPKILGGEDETDNLALACQGCNNFKFVKFRVLDKETNNEILLFNPRQNKWQEHFKWNSNFTVLIALTPIGQVTINELQLNRENLINQRIVYRAFGIHPPLHSIE